MFYQIVYFIDCLLVLIILCLYIYLNCFLSHHSPQGPFFSVHQFFFPPSLFFVCGLLSFACISFLFFCSQTNRTRIYTDIWKGTYYRCSLEGLRNEWVRARTEIIHIFFFSFSWLLFDGVVWYNKYTRMSYTMY